MIKYVILFIHLIGLSIYQLFFGDVTASQKIPDKIKAGEEVTVEINITKDNVNGFAKVQQTLPNGFFAEVIDAKGATFSFKENTVKFIWMALPSENQFTITYKLKTTTDIVGDFSVGGKFSFISDNERKNVDIPASSITISKEEISIAQEKSPEVVTEPIATTQEKPIETQPEKIEEPVVSEINSNKVEIKTARTIEKIGEKYKVTLKINQKNIDGFAKYSDVIPVGFIATNDNPEGGIFSFKDAEAKILWMSVPKKDEFSVSYFIEPTSDSKNATFDVNGSFSYLENDETKKHIINSTSFTYAAQTLAQVEPEKVEPVKVVETPKENKTTPVEPNKPKENKVATEKQPVKTTPEVTSTPSPEKGVTFKIQVGAGHQTVSKSYFASKFNLNESVATENHDGWIKYIVGKYAEYKQAKDKRNDLRNNVKTAFVTAYNQGKRITVQEALMISNQKWYQ